MKKRFGQVFAMLGATVVALAAIFLIDKVILGEKEAEEKVNAYEIEHNIHPEKVDVKYDWYSGGGYIGDNYRYNREKDIILDEEYNELWRPFFEKRMEEVKRFMDYNFIIDDYGIATYFDGTDKRTRYDDLFIYGIYNTQPVAEESRIEEGAEIIMKIISEMGYTYNFCGVHIDYYDLNGVYRFSVAMGKESVTKEMLMSSATEVSFEGNLAIREKWEAFCSQRVTLWTLEVDDYEVSLVGMEEYGDYQLVLKDGDDEKVVWIYQDYVDDIEYKYGTFDNILGYSGFYVFEWLKYMPYGNFYTILDGELICVAQTWGNAPEDCYSVDVDDNGVPELICNVRYGDGVEDAIIYENYMSQILRGSCSDLLDVTYDNVNYASQYSNYLPDEEVVEIYYWLNSINDFESKKYEIDLSKILFSEFIGR